MAPVEVKVESGDVLSVRADVLILKHAQVLYGADAEVFLALQAAGTDITLPKPWNFCLVESVPSIAASRVLFVGVPPIGDFGYR